MPNLPRADWIENMTTQFAQLVRLQLNNTENAAFQITPSSLSEYA